MQQIRKAKQEDVPAIQKICRESLGYEVSLAACAQHFAAIAAMGKEHRILVAEAAEGEVVGFLHAESYQTLYFEPVWNVLAFAVLPGFQSQGYGKQLLSMAEKEAKAAGMSALRLNSGMERKAAHRFYQARGFLERKEQKNFWKNLQ